MLNRYADNFQLTSTSIKYSLYILQTLYISHIAAVTYISVFVSLKVRYKKLDYLSYVSLKYFANT